MATVTEVRAKLDQINDADFQIICDQYLSKKGYPNIVCLGTEAGAHKTTSGTPDTYFCRDDGKYVFVEYTTKKKGLVGKIQEDLQKCRAVCLCELEEESPPVLHSAGACHRCHSDLPVGAVFAAAESRMTISR